jgi:hypothetical protein
MGENAKKKKEKKKKRKQQINILKKGSGISKKLTKQEENQALLSAMNVKKIKETDIETDESFIKLETRRTYICSCGCHVTLEGETYKRKVKDGFELCSKCSK